MVNITLIFPEADQLKGLPVEEVAGAILKALAEEQLRDPRKVFHPKNEANSPFSRHGSPYPPETWEDLKRVLMEAMSWLQIEGLICEAPDQANHGWCFVTRRGFDAARDFGAFRQAKGLPRDQLAFTLAERVWPLFIAGQFDTAVFQAFKEVEVTVREASGLAEGDLGVNLMRKAFHAENGPLRNEAIPAAERHALSDLFAGAIGYYKNPQSHRNVGTTDRRDAIEMIMLANHLIRIVEARRAA